MIISLPVEDERKLSERARAAGQEPAEFVRHLIANELAAPVTIAEAAGPVADAVDAAGVGDDEYLGVLRTALDASRRSRRGS